MRRIIASIIIILIIAVATTEKVIAAISTLSKNCAFILTLEECRPKAAGNSPVERVRM
jgi:hypothetical protein